MQHDLKWFEDFYLGLNSLQHKHLITKQPHEWKVRYMQVIMPTIMTVGRLPYSCRDVFHPGKTCSQYFLDKIIRSTINCAKITFIASLIPQIIKKRKKLFQSKDPKVILKNVKLVLVRYFRAALFLIIGTALPFITVCYFPLNSLIFQSLPQSLRLCLAYGTLPILSLAVDLPSKMPSYMGFFNSKAISMGWSLLKTYGYISEVIAFEKQIGMAILAAVVGYIAVKKAKLRRKTA